MSLTILFLVNIHINWTNCLSWIIKIIVFNNLQKTLLAQEYLILKQSLFVGMLMEIKDQI